MGIASADPADGVVEVRLTIVDNASHDAAALEDLRQHLEVDTGLAGTVDTRGTERARGTEWWALVLGLANAAVPAAFVAAVATWLAKDRRRTLKIQVGDASLEASNLTAQEHARFVKWFERHIMDARDASSLSKRTRRSP